MHSAVSASLLFCCVTAWWSVGGHIHRVHVVILLLTTEEAGHESGTLVVDFQNLVTLEFYCFSIFLLLFESQTHLCLLVNLFGNWEFDTGIWLFCNLLTVVYKLGANYTLFCVICVCVCSVCVLKHNCPLAPILVDNIWSEKWGFYVLRTEQNLSTLHIFHVYLANVYTIETTL